MSTAHGLALALMARMHEVVSSGSLVGSPLTLLAVGQTQVVTELTRLERRTQRSAWSLNPRPSFDPEDGAYALEARSRGRGVDLQMITPARSLRFNPLLTSLSPEVRLGPVLVKAILVDEQAAVLAGPETAAGDTTAWLARNGEFLDRTLELWGASVAESEPALADGTQPPLDQRQLDVARGVCLGRTDAAIARRLGISQRTVARDVAAILDVTRSRSRAEAVLNMLGRGRQSRA